MSESEKSIPHFLVVYDVMRSSARVEEYGNYYDAALAAYAEREQEHRFDPAYEVVLLGADSLETVKRRTRATSCSRRISTRSRAISAVLRP